MPACHRVRAVSGMTLHDAVLLAAGGSRRLGRPKQLLMREGEPLVRRAARLALATAPRRLLVVTGGAGDAVAAALDGLVWQRVHHAGWATGLAGSLRAAGDVLGADASPSVLLVGCDQPALASAHLHALLAGSAAVSSGCAATRHAEARLAARVGIPAVVPADWLRGGSRPMTTGRAPMAQAGPGGAAARDNGSHPDRGLGQRLRALPPASLWMLDAPDLRCDIDTRDDMRAAIARGWLDADATVED